MKSQISDALCVGRPLPLIPGDMSYLDVLIVMVKLWTSIDLKLQSPQSVFELTFFSSLPSGSVGCPPSTRMAIEPTITRWQRKYIVFLLNQLPLVYPQSGTACYLA